MKFILLALICLPIFAKTKSLETRTDYLVNQLSRVELVGAHLLTEILVSDNYSSQKVRIKFFHDVFDKTGKLIIPKHTVGKGKTQSFDADKNVMSFKIDTVSLEGKDYHVNFNVTSADLSPGLKGEVRDTHGNFLRGSFITSYTKEAQEALKKSNPGQTLQLDYENLGAGLQGGSQVAQRIAEMYAGDLNQSVKIFYVPATIPLILVPAK